MSRFDLVRIPPCNFGVWHFAFIYRNALSGDGGLVYCTGAFNDKPICWQPFIGLYDYDVAYFQFLYGYLLQATIPAHPGSLRGEFC